MWVVGSLAHVHGPTIFFSFQPLKGHHSLNAIVICMCRCSPSYLLVLSFTLFFHVCGSHQDIKLCQWSMFKNMDRHDETDPSDQISGKRKLQHKIERESTRWQLKGNHCIVYQTTSFYLCGVILSVGNRQINLDLKRFERSYLSEDIVACDVWSCTENDGFRIYQQYKKHLEGHMSSYFLSTW